jgi:hypothetical protein
VRVRTENARMLKENRQSIDFRPDDIRQRLDNVYQGERPDVALVLWKIETSQHMLSQRQLDING